MLLPSIFISTDHRPKESKINSESFRSEREKSERSQVEMDLLKKADESACELLLLFINLTRATSLNNSFFTADSMVRRVEVETSHLSA
jgi:hypothetical protein